MAHLMIKVGGTAICSNNHLDMLVEFVRKIWIPNLEKRIKMNVCPECSTPKLYEVDTFRNVWLWCLTCGNAYKTTKAASLLTGEDLELWDKEDGYLWRYERATAGGADPYDKYSTEEYFNSRDHASEFDRVLNKIIKRNRLPLMGNIIDVSGGPGGVAELLQVEAQKDGGQIYVTELTEASVDYMRRKLSVPVGRYDFQTDQLGEVFGVQFDVILIRGCLNYCLNIRKLASSLRLAAKPGALVFVSSYLPTLGTMLRWQFDEHFVPVLYNPETIARAFAEFGFKVRNRYEYERIDYMEGFNPLLDKFSRKYLDACRDSPIPKELHEKYYQAIFEFKGTT